MSLDVLRLFDARSQQFAPIGSQYVPPFCLLLLTAACALASFAFACATPFAAFAAIAAAMLRLPAALLVVAAAWIVNQAIGFGALGYPIDLNTMLWGTAIGAVDRDGRLCAGSARGTAGEPSRGVGSRPGRSLFGL